MMDTSSNLDTNSIFSGLNMGTNDDFLDTKYINKVENLSLRGDNLHITVTTKRSFGDYVWGYIFFVMRCVVIFLIPLYLFVAFGLNLSDLVPVVRNNVVNQTDVGLDGGWNLNSLLNKTDVLDEYVGLMDDLLEK